MRGTGRASLGGQEGDAGSRRVQVGLGRGYGLGGAL